MEILAKTFLVYGTKITGQSAVRFLLEKGAKTIYVFDDNNCDPIEGTIKLCNFEEIKGLCIDYVILSPGVTVLGNKNIELLERLNIKYISEFCLGLLCCRGKTICITGTNGKTTTVNLLYQMLKTQKKDIFLCGNTDTPITQIANKTTYNSILVCEVSSFALESITSDFRPNISVILNITKDHISRHKTFDNYKNTKINITKNQKNNDIFICEKNMQINTRATKFNYSLNDTNTNIYVKNNYIIFNNKKILNVKKIKLLGNKNLENILCAVLIAKLFNIKNRNIRKIIYSFKPLSHRMEQVYCKKGIQFIDDSKATNPDSTICALESFNKNVILLLGGSDKGYSYDEIFNYTQNVKTIITFGEMNKAIYECAKSHNFNNVTKFDCFYDAVVYSKKVANKGDIVLLSPACASFDEFSSYKQRGEKFLKILKGDNEKIKS